MSANFESVELERLPRGTVDGVYYGPEVHVLARIGEKLLLWVPGHSAWNGTGRPWRYEPSSIYVHAPRSYRRLSSGGRQKARLAELGDRIDEHFGDGFHKLLEPGRTVVVGEDQVPPPSPR